MTPAEIHAHLTGIFGDALTPWLEPKAGDSCIVIRAEALLRVCQHLRDEAALAFDFLRLVSALDRTTHLSSVYHLYSYRHRHSLTVRVDVSRENPRIPSLCGLWPAANWLERECFDMVGIVYEGHPDLRRILLPHDWEGYPLRKDYKQPQGYHGIKHG